MLSIVAKAAPCVGPATLLRHARRGALLLITHDRGMPISSFRRLAIDDPDDESPMTDAADILNAMILEQTREPMTRADAEELADRWYEVAIGNGSSAAEMDDAAGMPVPDYILQTFGEAGQELML